MELAKSFEPADIERIIKTAMGEHKLSSKHVMVTLSHHFGILRYFTLPSIDRRFWKTALPAEAKKYIPINFATLVNDFQVVPVPPGPDKRPKLGVLFGVTPRNNMDSIRELVTKLGLQLVGVELAPVSTERLWDTLEPVSEPYAQVHFDGGHVRILVSEEGIPIFFRDVFLPEGATVMDRRKVDLNGCIDFARKQIGTAGPTSIRLSGHIGDMAAWREAFSQDLGREVTVLDVDKSLGLRGGQWGGYAAIGAGMRALATSNVSLDLAGAGRVSEEDRRAATMILFLSFALSGLLLVVGLIRYASAGSKARQLRVMQADAEISEAFKDKSVADIEAEIEEMRKKAESFGALTVSQVPLTRLLEAIAEDIPRSAWITGIDYDNPLAYAGKRHSRTLTIRGKVVDSGRAIEQATLIRFYVLHIVVLPGAVAAAAAKDGCPVSNALKGNVEFVLDARLA